MQLIYCDICDDEILETPTMSTAMREIFQGLRITDVCCACVAAAQKIKWNDVIRLAIEDFNDEQELLNECN